MSLLDIPPALYLPRPIGALKHLNPKPWCKCCNNDAKAAAAKVVKLLRDAWKERHWGVIMQRLTFFQQNFRIDGTFPKFKSWFDLWNWQLCAIFCRFPAGTNHCYVVKIWRCNLFHHVAYNLLHIHLWNNIIANCNLMQLSHDCSC